MTVKAAGLNPHSGSHWKRLSRRRRRMFRASIKVSFLLEVCQSLVVLVCSSISCLLYSGILLTDRERCYGVKGTNQRIVQRRMAWRPVTAWKKKKACSLPPFGRFLFSLRMRHPFSCLGPLGVSANLIVFFFFLIQFKFILFYLFIRSLQLHTLQWFWTGSSPPEERSYAEQPFLLWSYPRSLRRGIQSAFF